MCGKENRLIGYSERGVMNALFYSIANDKAEMENFLKLTGQSFSLQDDYKIYMEPSLSDFGDPDAIIIDNDNVFFIEAKVCARNTHWSIEKEWEKYEGYKNPQNVNKPKSSLFTQLYWKTLLVNLGKEKTAKSKIRDPFFRRKDQNRSIGDNPFVKQLFEKIKGRNPYYIGIIPIAVVKDNLLNKIQKDFNHSFSFIPWKLIEREVKSYDVKETFKNNKCFDKEKSKVVNQIYVEYN